VFEHALTYVPVRYQKGPSGGPFEGPELQTEPDPASPTQDAGFDRLFHQIGLEGWEQVGVQPLLKGQYDKRGAFLYGLGYSITAGYYPSGSERRGGRRLVSGDAVARTRREEER
jgi:hypothetical protein